MIKSLMMKQASETAMNRAHGAAELLRALNRGDDLKVRLSCENPLSIEELRQGRKASA